MVLVLLAGCAPKAKQEPAKPAPEPQKEESKERLKVATERAHLEHKDEKGNLVLALDSQESLTDLNRKDAKDVQTLLKTVSGQILKDGKIVSRFKSPSGTFNRRTGILTLDQGVTITSEPAPNSKGTATPAQIPLTMTASRIVWKESTDLITAEGSVWIKGQQFEAGPAAKLVTTPNLRKFGTPDRFKK